MNLALSLMNGLGVKQALERKLWLSESLMNKLTRPNPHHCCTQACYPPTAVQRHAEKGFVQGVDGALPGADRPDTDKRPASDRVLPAPHDLPGGCQRPGCGLAGPVPDDRQAVKLRHPHALRCRRSAGRLRGSGAGRAVVVLRVRLSSSLDSLRF